MALLDRVSTLLKANLNDLVEKAEDPERMLKQVVLDMENQLLQVKTQVAIAIADQHLLDAQPVIAKEYMPLVMSRVSERSKVMMKEMMKEMAEIVTTPKQGEAQRGSTKPTTK